MQFRSRRPNGATQTFRRPSLATSLSNSTPPRDASAGQPLTPNAGVYVPPHVANRNATTTETRLSRDALLQAFQVQKDANEFADGLSPLYVAEWTPNISNGVSSAIWGRKDEHKDHPTAADVCWDRDGIQRPLGQTDMSSDEKEASLRVNFVPEFLLTRTKAVCGLRQFVTETTDAKCCQRRYSKGWLNAQILCLANPEPRRVRTFFTNLDSSWRPTTRTKRCLSIPFDRHQFTLLAGGKQCRRSSGRLDASTHRH